MNRRSARAHAHTPLVLFAHTNSHTLHTEKERHEHPILHHSIDSDRVKRRHRKILIFANCNSAKPSHNVGCFFCFFIAEPTSEHMCKHIERETKVACLFVQRMNSCEYRSCVLVWYKLYQHNHFTLTHRNENTWPFFLLPSLYILDIKLLRFFSLFVRVYFFSFRVCRNGFVSGKGLLCCKDVHSTQRSHIINHFDDWWIKKCIHWKVIPTLIKLRSDTDKMFTFLLRHLMWLITTSTSSSSRSNGRQNGERERQKKDKYFGKNS